MSRDELEAASDEQLNEWAAVKVMGYRAGRLLGRDVWMDENNVTCYGATKAFTPATDAVQGITLLDKIQKDTGLWWQIGSPLSHPDDRYHVMVMGDMRKGYPRVAASKSDKSLTRAIVIAALLAVEWMQEEV